MRGLVFSSLVLIAVQASGSDLLTVYNDAMQNSPLPQNYLATKLSTQQTTPIALGALLPQVSATGNATYADTDVNGSYKYMGYGLNITQTLFNYSAFAGWAGASDNSNAAEATYQSNMQNFILTVATDYFNVLLAQDNVEFAQSEVASLKTTLDQTKAKFSVGLATYTDVLQAKANYDSAIATLIANKNTLDDANQTLKTLTDKIETNLAVIKNDFPFDPPVPNDIDAWTEHAIQNNQTLIAQRYTTKAALANVNVTVGNQLPTVSLVATYGQTFYPQDISAAVAPGPKVLTASIALQLSWTIFSGGEQMASSLQAANQYASSQNTELNLFRETTTQARQDFLSVLANISQVAAYKQSVLAAESSLRDYNAKYKVGTATIVDVLNATQTLYQAKSNLANAEYEYITSLLQLKYDAGILNQQDLVSLNKYLQVTQ